MSLYDINEYDASITVTQSLVEAIINKESNYDARVEGEQKKTKNKLRQHRITKCEQEVADVRLKIPQEMKQNVGMAQEKGASACLTAILRADYDGALHKGDFSDSLCI